MQSLNIRCILKSNLRTIGKQLIRNSTITCAGVKHSKEPSQLKSWKEIPGPSSLPIIGLLRHFLPGGSLAQLNTLDKLTYLYNTYGPIVRMDATFNMPTHIILFDPESVAKVLQSEVAPVRLLFESFGYYRNQYKKIKDTSVKRASLLTDHGELWKEYRSIVNPILMQPKTIRLYKTAIDEVAMDMVKRLRTIRDEHNGFHSDFRVEMNLWALESIAVIALGIRLNCFDTNLPEDAPVRRFIKLEHDLFDSSKKLDLELSLWKYFPTPAFKRAMKIYEEHDNLARSFVQKGKKELEKNQAKFNSEKTVFEKLLEINEEFAVIMAIDLFIAGSDATANGILSTLYHLSTNPAKQDKLREEIMSKQEKRPYLKACIKESMRMIPPIPLLTRVTTKEFNLLGYHIPKNTILNFAHYKMSLMEEYYPRANEFIPERWLVRNDDPLYPGNTHSFASTPFSYGPRSCIGRRIADLGMETLLTRIIENFRLEWFGEPARIGQIFINFVEKPHNFIFKDVSSS